MAAQGLLTPLQRLYKILSIIRKEVGLVYVYALFQGLIQLSLPLGIQAIISLLFAGQVSSSWVLLVGVVVAGVLFAGALQIMQLLVTEHIQRKIFTLSSFEFAYRITRLKLEAVDRKYLPELINRFFDTMSIQKGLSKLLNDFATGTIQIVFGLILLSLYHPLFIAFGLLLVILLLMIIRLTGPQGMKASIEESSEKYKVAHWLEEIARALGTFKLAGRTELPMHRTDELVEGYLDARKSHFRILVIQAIALIGFKTLVTGGLLILGGLLVLDQQINLGQFVAAEIVIILIMNAVEKLILNMEPVYDTLTSLEKLGTVTDLPLERDEGVRFEEEEFKRPLQVEISRVDLPSAGGDRRGLSNIELKIAAGEKLCVAGYNGSGKSTLLSLIGGLYQDYRGILTYNGIPLNNYSPESLRSVIGDNLAQEEIFFGTIAENISLGRPNVTMKDIAAAAETMRLSQHIQRLPAGFETEISPGDPTIPKSVMRKIILARAIVDKPRLLLLEDTVGSLDPEDQEAIIQALVSCPHWTLVIVSNNFRVAGKCDRIVVMKEGEVIKEGKGDQLRNDGYCEKLFQF